MRSSLNSFLSCQSHFHENSKLPEHAAQGAWWIGSGNLNVQFKFGGGGGGLCSFPCLPSFLPPSLPLFWDFNVVQGDLELPLFFLSHVIAIWVTILGSCPDLSCPLLSFFSFLPVSSLLFLSFFPFLLSPFLFFPLHPVLSLSSLFLLLSSFSAFDYVHKRHPWVTLNDPVLEPKLLMLPLSPGYSVTGINCFVSRDSGIKGGQDMHFVPVKGNYLHLFWVLSYMPTSHGDWDSSLFHLWCFPWKITLFLKGLLYQNTICDVAYEQQ